MSAEWEKPPPKLVRGKRKFPRWLIYLIIGVYLGGVASTWGVVGRWVPINVIMILWLVPVFFLAVIIGLTWWVTG
jgi:fatty acid desaturase